LHAGEPGIEARQFQWVGAVERRGVKTYLCHFSNVSTLR
jgi:hypothetical protein